MIEFLLTFRALIFSGLLIGGLGFTSYLFISKKIKERDYKKISLYDDTYSNCEKSAENFNQKQLCYKRLIKKLSQ